jgi:hypothetical protein
MPNTPYEFTDVDFEDEVNATWPHSAGKNSTELEPETNTKEIDSSFPLPPTRDSEICAICHEPFTSRTEVLACGHFFNRRCINNWLSLPKQKENFHSAESKSQVWLRCAKAEMGMKKKVHAYDMPSVNETSPPRRSRWIYAEAYGSRFRYRSGL